MSHLTALPSCPSHPFRPGDRALFDRYRDGDLQAREELVRRFMPLARSVARRFRDRGMPLEDLTQVAYVGLLKAIDRYEPELGGFPRYAVPSLMGDLKRHFRDAGWALHVPRSLQEQLLSVNAAIEALTTETGHGPRAKEIAAYTGLSVEQVMEARSAGETYTLSSLDAPVEPGGGDSELSSRHERTGREDPRYESVETGDAVRRALRGMPARQQAAVRHHVLDDLKQAEIAGRIGVSQMQVSRLLRRAARVFRDRAAV